MANYCDGLLLAYELMLTAVLLVAKSLEQAVANIPVECISSSIAESAKLKLSVIQLCVA